MRLSTLFPLVARIPAFFLGPSVACFTVTFAQTHVALIPLEATSGTLAFTCGAFEAFVLACLDACRGDRVRVPTQSCLLRACNTPL